MRCKVLFFAQAADAAGTRSTEIELPPGATVADALDHLARRHPDLTGLRPQLAVAVDEGYAAPGAVLTDGCTIALIPPVSGG